MRIEVTLDCADPRRLAEFWTKALGYVEVGADEPYVTLAPAGARGGPPLVLQRVAEPKVGKLRMHLDLYPDDVDAEIVRLESLGATRLGDDVIEEAGERWVVLADPEGNEFCVCQQHPPAG